MPDAVQIVDLNKSRTIRALPALISYLRNANQDIVLSALFYTNIVLLCARLLCPASRSKIIVSERNHLSSLAKNSSKFLDRIAPFLVFIFYRFADKIVGISKGVADDIQNIAGLKGDRVSWIHNPVVTDGMLAQLEEKRAP